MNPSALTGSSGAALLRRWLWLRLVAVGFLMPGLMISTSPVLANPSGGIVVHGDVQISGTNGNLQILQNSSNAIIHWDSFSIASGELTRFFQPSSSSAVLNRVTGGDPSSIYGALQANGNVFVINPSGILVGPGGSIDVHGLVLSTLDIGNGEFLAGGDMVFKGTGDAGVTNLGRINAIGGDVFLIGKTVTNSGSITAPHGTVGLAAGEEVLLTAEQYTTGERIFVRAKGSGVSGTGIYNDGTIEGAAVEMKAHGNIYALAINNKGSVRATGATNSGGRVFLKGIGGEVRNGGSIEATSPGNGNAGRVLIEAAYAKVDGMLRSDGGDVRVAASARTEMSGTVDVSSEMGRGGEVVIEGREIEIGSGAVIDASGRDGGGSMRIGGGFQGRDAEVANAESLAVESEVLLLANSREDGDGGTVILWSDQDTVFRGDISTETLGAGRGGFVEVSGKERLGFHGFVSTLAADGSAGTLLLDPANGTISNSPDNHGGDPFNINAANLVTALGSSNVVISTPSGGASPGHLTFQDEVIWNSEFSLAALAHGDIDFQSSVQNEGVGEIVVVAGWDGVTGLPGSSPYDTTGGVTIGDFSGNAASFGNSLIGDVGYGSVRVGTGSQTAGVAVGSRGGATYLAGHAVEVRGGGTSGVHAHIGYRTDSPGDIASGAVTVAAKGGGVLVQAGAGTSAYAQIGHGGRGPGEATSGQIAVLSYDGSAYGDIILKGGGGTDAYAQIGHGGSHNLANHGAAGDFINVDGASVIVEGGGGTRTYAQIGSGGATSVTGSFEAALIGDVNINQNGGGSGTVELKGGTGTESYAQIGIGGTAWDGDKTGSTRVTATAVTLTSGRSAAYTLIGAGGGILSNATDFGSGTITGATWVTATNGGVSLNAGNGGAQAFAQIGMGGLLHDGIFNGIVPISTTVSATGAITLQGGGASNTYAQIGAGGAGGGLVSDIGHRHNAGVSVTGASVSLTAGGSTSAYAQIGSGGGRTGSGNRSEGDVSGDVIVSATSGEVTLTGGGNNYSYAQIGHGGSGVVGALSGDIRVTASGAVSLTGRTGSGTYAQIGHGGDAGSGVMSGAVRVAAAGGDLTLTGGTGANAYAMTGHGARSGSLGTRQGGIHLFADGILSAGTGTRLFHQSGSDLAATSYLGGEGVQVIGNGNLSFSDDALTGVDAMINGNLGLGPVQLAFSNDIDITLEGAEVAVTGADHFYLLSGGDILVRRGYQNAGTGGVWLGAGWDGDMDVLGNGTVDTVSPGAPFLTGAALDFNRCSFGANDGSLRVGVAEQTSAVRVGSRAGGTQFAGDAVTLTAGTTDAAVHLGFYGAGGDAISGAIGVRVGGGGLELRGGSSGAYAQIGHGGFGSVGLDVVDTATIKISFCEPGAVTLQGGTSTNAYAHIGHGGVQTGSNTRNGDVTVTGFEGLTLNGGNSTGAYAQIGNGGHLNTGSISSHTTVTGTGLILLGSASAGTSSHIGAGGSGAQGTKTGDVTVTGGGIVLRGGVSSVQIGNGGAFIGRFATGNGSGTVTVTANGAGMTGPDAGSIHMAGGGTIQAYVQIGNGGLVADGNITGPTVVNASGALTMTSGSGNNAYAHIGIGGAGVDGVMNGAVDVTAASLSMTSVGNAGYVLIGQGGGATAAGDGNQRFGRINGDVTVNTTAGGIEMKSEGINSVRNFVQIGAGGGGAGISNGGGGNSVASITTVTTVGGGLTMNATNADYVQIGAGGRGFTSSGITGAVNVDIDGAVTLSGGDAANRYVQIGHGGTRSEGAMNGAVSVFAVGSIGLNGGAIDDTYAQIGHGGQYSAGVKTGAIHVTAGTSLTQTAGAGLHSHTRIGHGGFRSADDASGAVKVSVTGGNLVLMGGTAHYAYSQIGHGATFDPAVSGEPASIMGVTYEGDICVDVSGKVELLAQAGGGNGAHAQIGHGGRRVTGVFDGDVTVTSGLDAGAADKGIYLQGLTTSSKFAQIGHGGVHSHGPMSGEVRVLALNGGDITLEGNTAWEHSYAMIGHGASSTLNSGTRQGGIHLFADGNITATNANTSVTHLSGGVFHDSHYLAGAGSGYQLIANGTATYDDAALRGVSAMVNGNFASGNIAVAFSNDIDIVVAANQNRNVNTSDGFHILTGGGITMQSGYQNAGSGDVTLVAGWNGVGSVSGSVTFNGTGYCDPVISAGGVTVDFTNCAVTGNNGSTVTLGATNQTQAVRVGSREGVTSVAGYGLSLNASTATANAATQLGFYGDGSGDAAGAIEIRLKQGGLRLNSGAVGAYTQIGHGGLGSISGNTTAAATISISFCEAGAVDLIGGSGTDAYAQIGHGGVRTGTHNRFGNVSVSGFNSLTLDSGGGYAYTQIGNGGLDTDGTILSDVEVFGSGAISLLSGGTRGYAQIGSGGAGSDGDKTGTVVVEGDSVSVDANAGDHAYAQIGLGGGFTSTDFSNGILIGDVSVTATNGGVSLIGGSAAQSYAQIGNGGLVANVRESGSIVAGEAISGKTTVTAAGVLTMTGSTGGNAYVQIGAGGAGLDGHIADADVEVLAESVTMTAGRGGATYVQIGSGGGATGSGSNTRTGAVSGNVTVTTTGGGISMASSEAGAWAYAQIGAGGGGYLDGGVNGGAGRSLIGNTTVTTVGGGLTMDSGLASYVQIGAGGVNVDAAEITGTTRVNVDGDIELRGGSAADRYAMIGLGGSQSDAVVDGAVSVEASGKIELFGGSGADAFVQIGHGGRSTTGATTGEVSVISGGILDLAGGGAGSHAQIGHGGSQSSGAVVGAVEVSSVGDLSLGAGTGNWSHARIGHGGRLNTGDKTGSVKVSVTEGDLRLQGAAPTYAYAQIGHGATFETHTAVSAGGDICVDVGGKISLGVSTGSGGAGGHAQIGHGARRMDGSHAGDITVVSGTNAVLGGGIDLRGAVTSSLSRFAQIGHGGVYSAGAMSGDISVVALNGGSVTLVGGTAQQHSAAMIGHGESGGISTGTRQGGIHIFADDKIETIGAYTSVTHLSGTGLSAGNYLGGNGFQLVANGGSTFRNQADTADSNEALRGLPTMLNKTFGSGPVNFAFSNDIDIVVGANQNRSVNTTDGFHILTGGSITMLSGYQNAGSGDMTLVAGWNGMGSVSGSVTFNGAGYCDPMISAGGVTVDFTNCEVTGNNSKTVTLGATNQTGAVRVGSREGVTSVAGYGLTLHASTAAADAATQLGFYGDGSGDVGGAIDVRLKAGGLRLQSGSQSGAHTQIGHGGLGSVSGNTTPAAMISISFCEPGDVVLNGSTGVSAYAQIGHGGRGTSGTRNGAISLVGFNHLDLNGGSNANYGYAQIGHGGSGADFGSVSGATITLSGTGNATIDGGGTYTHAMIGHGGNGASGVATNSGIFLDMVGGIALTGGGTQESAAQIGHGGHNALNLRAVDSGIRINAVVGTGTGDLLIVGGGTNTYAMIGHGGSRTDGNIGAGDNSASGEIQILRSSNVRVLGGSNTDGVAQIGHGGERSPGSQSGKITVATAGEIEVRGGTAGNYAIGKIGHGGVANRGTGASDPGGDKSGDIELEAGGSIILAGGAAAYASAQVGHGGHQNRADFDGAVALTAGGDIVLTGGTGLQASTQVGHGGFQSEGERSGAVSLSAGSEIRVTAGASGQDNYAQVGHGGRTAGGAATGAVHVEAGGDVTVTAGLGASGNERYAQIGHGSLQGTTGDRVGDVTVRSGGDILLQGGGAQNAYVQIGNGGRQARGDHSGDIVMEAAGSITGQAGTSGSRTGVMVGHGGSDAASGSGAGNRGDIVVNALGGAVNFIAGGGEDGQARIGHGGPLTGGNHNGLIAVSSGSGIAFTAGNGNRALAQIGHGGGAVSGHLGGDIFLNIDPLTLNPFGGGPIELTAGSGAGGAYAQVGHGGLSASGNTSGSIVAFSSAGISLRGGVTDAYAMLGHGGRSHVGNHGSAGDVVVAVAMDGVEMLGGTGTRSFVQIGHGGNGSNGTLTGDVLVNFNPLTGTPLGGGHIEVRGGTGTEAFAQIGLGGLLNGSQVGSTAVFGESVSLQVGSGTIAYSRIGAGGGVNNVAAVTGSTTVRAAGGGVSVNSANGGGNAYAQIGAGGLGGEGAVVSGATSVHATGAIELVAGGGTNASAVIGAGGAGRDGNKDAAVDVSGASVFLRASSGGAAYAQIGSGGGLTNSNNASSGNVSGSVSVVATSGDIILDGAGNRAYAQIGHGGLDFSGNVAGDLHLVSTGDLSVNGGTVANAYAMVGHGGITEAAAYTGGTRQGDVLLRVAGTTRLADNASTSFLGHLGAGGTVAASRFALVTAYLDLTASALGMVGDMLNGGSVEIGVTQGDLSYRGFAPGFHSAHHMDLFAAGNVEILGLVQNGGTGDINVVAGWDGSTGLVEDINLGSLPAIDELRLDASAVLGDPATWGNGGGNVRLGDGTQTSAVAVGSAAGTTTVLSHGLALRGSDGSAGGSAQIGYRSGGASGVGDISIEFKGGDVVLQGGAASGASVHIGHSGIGGDHSGAISLQTGAPFDLSLLAGTGANAYAQIGHAGPSHQGSASGDLAISPLGDLVLAGGGNGAYAQIGHGGVNSGSTSTARSGDIDLLTESTSVRGGTGLTSYAQIGHGGSGAKGSVFDGAVSLVATQGIDIVGGLGGLAYAQIGHGGAMAHADMDGAVTVEAGGDVAVRSVNLATLGYAKIGHGDDLRGSFASNGGTGLRDGAVQISAGGDISLEGAQIGHVGSASPAVLGAGATTWLAVSKDVPADPSGGSLAADAASEFGGSDVRFYLPRRANNTVASGVWINGTTYDGGVNDPWPVQRADEYTIFLETAGGLLQPAEHNSSLGDGAAPAVAGGYAFYYDTIVQGGSFPPLFPPVPPTSLPLFPGLAVPPGAPDPDYASSFPDDRALNDWLKRLEEYYSGPGEFSILYEGYAHYGPNGESIYHSDSAPE